MVQEPSSGEGGEEEAQAGSEDVHGIRAEDFHNSWDDLKDAPVAVAEEEEVGGTPRDDEEIVQDDQGRAHQVPRELPSPKAPSLAAIRKHNITHWPYAPWCPWCVMARRNSEPHCQAKGENGRTLPLLVLDYCFIKNEADTTMLTLLVGKLYPYRKTFACVVDAKGVDQYAIARMSEFIRQSGLSNLYSRVIRSHQSRPS